MIRYAPHQIRAWLAGLLLAASPAWGTCPGDVALQVLGSGGPIADDDRAGTGYLLWLDGRPRLLVDLGAGAFLRFGESGADLESLDAVALTHVHTDHAADLPGLLKTGYFSDRDRPLPVIGPSGSDRFPGMESFMDALFGAREGAFRYLSGYLDGSDGLFHTPLTETDAGSREPEVVFENDRFRLRAVGVNHGIVPALGYLIETSGRRIAISGDQNDDNPAFARMAEGADLLVMHHAIPPGAGETARALHATPEGIGRVAAQTGTGQLLLSHLMARSLDSRSASLAAIRQHYDGAVETAGDGLCVAVETGD